MPQKSKHSQTWCIGSIFLSKRDDNTKRYFTRRWVDDENERNLSAILHLQFCLNSLKQTILPFIAFTWWTTVHMMHDSRDARFTWCTIHVMHDSHDAWFTRCMIYMMHDLHDAWFTWCMIYVMHDLRDAWFTSRDAWFTWCMQWLN